MKMIYCGASPVQLLYPTARIVVYPGDEIEVQESEHDTFRTFGFVDVAPVPRSKGKGKKAQEG